MINVAIIGCGFVFDKYMDTWARHKDLNIVGISDINKSRLNQVADYYGLKAFPDNASLINSDVDIVLNLTSIRSHFEISKAALLAGKNVYSEKPLTETMEDAEELFRLAAENNVRLSSAPSNALSSLCQTMWKIILDGAIGDPKLVYAEFDTSPLYLKNDNFKTISGFPFLTEDYNVTPSGAPFPWKEELEMGCTFEHVGYHLVWMCALFGPVANVTSFSKQIMPEKTDITLDPPDTPDFSVGILNFKSGVVGRVTCSISGANDTSIKIIGNRGILHSHTYGDYEGALFIETFRRLSIKLRYIRGLDTNFLANFLFGVGGRKVPLVETRGKVALDNENSRQKHFGLRHFANKLRARFLGKQDKCIGIVELAAAIKERRVQFPPHDFSLHVLELTLAIQNAGPTGTSNIMKTDFAPLDLPTEISVSNTDYNSYTQPRKFTTLLEFLIKKIFNRDI